MDWLKIAVAAPINGTLSYTLPKEELSSNDQKHIGRRVLVNLSGRKITGYVVGLEEEKEVEYKVKAIDSFLDDYPLFHVNMVPFFEWVANYYHTPIGMTIKAALPSGLMAKSGKTLTLLDTARYQEHSKKFSSYISQKLNRLETTGSLSSSNTVKVLKDPELKSVLRTLQKEEIVELRTVLIEDKIREKVEVCYSLCDQIRKKVEQNSNQPYSTDEILENIKENTEQKLKLIEQKTLKILFETSGEIPQKELNKQYSGARKALPRLMEKGWVQKGEKRIFRNPFGGQYVQRPIPERLTDEQDHVLSKINTSIEIGHFAPFLLYGVTGSGKTEVYLRAAEKTIELGKDVLVLVPEIALATQLESHFISRFKDKVVLQHSGLSAGEKYDQWFNALTGKAKIVIGARSAIFSPLNKVGLIIVDEEHDPAFKQDDSFRYNGRDVAVLRAKFSNATVVLGSATPSITSYNNAVTGKYTLLEMKKRAGKQNLPQVHLIDLKKTNPQRKSRIFWPALEQALTDNYANGQQSIVLLNRRGFSSVVICRDCGTQVKCRNCNVSLTMHKSINRLICHYCNYSMTTETVCEFCRSDKLIPVGFGTERVEEELKSILPSAAIARLDSDSTKNKQEFLKTLKKMYSGTIDVMVGTQMIAKGHDFPGVTLVGVVFADSGLHMPDFRAGERTFQLISQVTGRAGRGEHAGRVFIQTMQPNHYAIKYAQGHQYEEFYEHELNIRRSPAYPPFVRLLAIHIDGELLDQVQKTGMNIRKGIVKWLSENGRNVEVLGPAPSPLDRLRERYRFQLLLKSAEHETLQQLGKVIEDAKNNYSVGKTTKIQIDVDPENMM